MKTIILKHLTGDKECAQRIQIVQPEEIPPEEWINILKTVQGRTPSKFFQDAGLENQLRGGGNATHFRNF